MTRLPVTQPATTRLTPTQRRILAQAALRQDGAILPTPEDLPVKGGALARTLDALLRRRLIEAERAATGATPRRRQDDGAPTLRISATGRQALADPRSGSVAIDHPSEIAKIVEQRPELTKVARDPGGGHQPRGGAADAGTACESQPSKVSAPPVRAEAGASATTGEPAIASPVTADTAEVPSTDTAATAGDAPVRPGGKLGLILQRLGTGASLGELVDATGWQKHTVRAALSRLRARGWPIRLAVEDGRKAYRRSRQEG